jgi:dihydroorotase-like cyclic amidohydrolase
MSNTYPPIVDTRSLAHAQRLVAEKALGDVAFGRPVEPDTWIELDPAARYTLAPHGSHTKCGGRPFEDLAAQGRVQRVVLRGQTAFEHGEVRVAPGSSRIVQPRTGG